MSICRLKYSIKNVYCCDSNNILKSLLSSAMQHRLLLCFAASIFSLSSLCAQSSFAQTSALSRSATSQVALNTSAANFRFVPFIVQEEDKFQSYIQNDALSVWVNLPSLRKNGDTLTAIVKRVLRHDITHTLNKDLVYVDVLQFNIGNDTFARIASLDTKTGALAMNAKPEWEKTTLDLDMTALYHFIGFLQTEKQKK